MTTDKPLVQTTKDEEQKVQELSFTTHGISVSGKRWNQGAKEKVIAVHGWLDNCGSFDPISALLTDCDIVALDSAGHGKSDFRSTDSQYLIWSEVGEIFDIADQLGWEEFHLIGHSRGAGITAMCAGTFPSRIKKLVLIEGGIPLPSEPKDTPKNLARHILDNKKLTGAPGTLFPTRETALQARANGFTKVTMNTARVLAKRSLIEVDGGFRWHADARLKGTSSLKLTHQQVDAFFHQIDCPCLFIEGSKGILKQMSFTEAHLRHIGRLQRAEFEGGHHLHMENATKECADLIHQFFTESKAN